MHGFTHVRGLQVYLPWAPHLLLFVESDNYRIPQGCPGGGDSDDGDGDGDGGGGVGARAGVGVEIFDAGAGLHASFCFMT